MKFIIFNVKINNLKNNLFNICFIIKNSHKIMLFQTISAIEQLLSISFLEQPSQTLCLFDNGSYINCPFELVIIYD